MIRFGPSGNSASFYNEGHKHTDETAAWLAERGLNAFEYSFGRGVGIGADTAERIGAEMTKHGIALSVHAPYYINLANEDDGEAVKSFMYIRQSVAAAGLMGGKRVVFHPGYVKPDRETALRAALSRLEALLRHLEEEEGIHDFILCPETMGRHSQLGTYAEICALCAVDGRLIPAFDWGHINSFSGGGLKGIDDYRRVLDYAFAHLTDGQARRMHMHFSKIQYGDKGEIRHLDFSDELYGPDFAPLAHLIKEYGMEPTVICESKDNMAEDALQMKRMYDNI
jgi:deoxyribonuclease-4